jgi:hypothetical protein
LEADSASSDFDINDWGETIFNILAFQVVILITIE